MKFPATLLFMLFLCGSKAFESTKCIFEPVKLSIFKGTSNVDADERKQMDQLAKNISSSIPNESTVFVAENWPIRNEVKQFGDTLSALALDDELKARYSVSQYKSRAEIVILFVSDTSKLDAVPSLLSKKKTFVVVFGSSIPNIYNSTASREDHLYLVRSKDELEAVTVRILKQIACDSRFYCDTDMYSVKKGSRCKNCSIPCGDDLTKRTKTCETRCPFKQRTSSKEDLELEPSMVPGAQVESLIADNKDLVIALVIGGICVLSLVILFVALFWYKTRRKRPLPPRSLEETLPKTIDLKKKPVEESRKDASSPEQAPFLSDDGSPQTDAHDQTQRKCEGEASINIAEDGVNKLLPFNDKRTMDLNAHYSEENVVFLNKSRRGWGARPITSQEEA